jgi:putative flippase GtrA
MNSRRDPDRGSFVLRPRGWLVILRFGAVGLLNTAFSYVVFAVLAVVSGWPAVALAGATVSGVIFNFQTSRRLVFFSDGRIIPFVAVYSVVFIFNWVSLRMLVSCGLSLLAAQGILTLPIAAVSFLGQQMFVFGKPVQPV